MRHRHFPVSAAILTRIVRFLFPTSLRGVDRCTLNRVTSSDLLRRNAFRAGGRTVAWAGRRDGADVFP